MWAVNLKAYVHMYPGFEFALVGFVEYTAEPLFTDFVDEMFTRRA